MELRIDEAIAFLEEAVARLGPGLDGPGRVTLEGQLGRAYFVALRAEDAAEGALRRTIEAAERIGPEEALIEAMISLGSSARTRGTSRTSPCSSAASSWRAAPASWRAEMRALNNLAA